MIPHVQILEKIEDCWGYLGSNVGGGYVAKPPLSLQLYVHLQNTGVFLIFYSDPFTLLSLIEEPLAGQDGPASVPGSRKHYLWQVFGS